MLILKRCPYQTFSIGKDIEIKVLSINKNENSVRIGINAPKNIKILRDDCINTNVIHKEEVPYEKMDDKQIQEKYGELLKKIPEEVLNV